MPTDDRAALGSAPVTVTDVALRDGLQDEARVVPTEQKVVLAERLAASGVPELEIGSFVRPDRVPQVADTAELLQTLRDRLDGVRLFTLVFNERGAQRAIDAGARDVRLVVSASDGHSAANAGVPVAEALDRLEAAAATLVAAGVSVEGAVATAFVCPYDGPTPPERVCRVVDRLVRMGATRISLADTIGAADPLQVRTTLAVLRDEQAQLDVGLHLHDTWGMAPAVVWQALDEGVRRFDAALGGIGGCPFAPGAAGNIATDDLVHLLHRTGHPTGIDTVALTAAREHLRDAVGHPLPSALAAADGTPAALSSV